MGGAFTALSDDASGIYYNPGGTPFANGKELSASASTFYLKETEYSEVFGKKNFEEVSRGTASSSLGGLLRVGGKKRGEGNILGFTFVLPDSNVANEDVSIRNESEAKIKEYRRFGSQRANTLLILGSSAFSIGDSFGVGFGLGFFDIDELSQSSEKVLQGPYSFQEAPTQSFNILSSRQERFVTQLRGYTAGAGLRWNLGGGFSLGLSGRYYGVRRKDIRSLVSVTQTLVDKDSIALGTDRNKPSEKPDIESSESSQNQSDKKAELPAQMRFGLAWSPANWFTVSADISHYTDTRRSSEILRRASVTNFHAGLEIFPAGVVFVRTGGFTNFDAGASRDVSNPESRGEYIDFLGLSASTGIRYSGSEYGLAFSRQWGNGEAEKVPGRNSRVTARSTVLSATVSQAL